MNAELRREIFCILHFAFCICLIACHRKPSIPADVVARVGDRMLTLADFKRYLDRNSGTDLAQMGPEVASAMIDQYLEEVILSEYAASHGLIRWGGAVWEWTADRFAPYPGFAPDPYAEYSAPWFHTHRSVRGGSFDFSPEVLRSALRGVGPEFRDRRIGFRCARVLPQRLLQ